MKSHTGALMTMGGGSIQTISSVCVCVSVGSSVCVQRIP